MEPLCHRRKRAEISQSTTWMAKGWVAKIRFATEAVSENYTAFCRTGLMALFLWQSCKSIELTTLKSPKEWTQLLPFPPPPSRLPISYFPSSQRLSLLVSTPFLVFSFCCWCLGKRSSNGGRVEDRVAWLNSRDSCSFCSWPEYIIPVYSI
jgi:hypothetical protein